MKKEKKASAMLSQWTSTNLNISPFLIFRLFNLVLIIIATNKIYLGCILKYQAKRW